MRAIKKALTPIPIKSRQGRGLLAIPPWFVYSCFIKKSRPSRDSKLARINLIFRVLRFYVTYSSALTGAPVPDFVGTAPEGNSVERHWLACTDRQLSFSLLSSYCTHSPPLSNCRRILTEKTILSIDK